MLDLETYQQRDDAIDRVGGLEGMRGRFTEALYGTGRVPLVAGAMRAPRVAWDGRRREHEYLTIPFESPARQASVKFPKDDLMKPVA